MHREINESTQMCHGAACQCTVAIPTFQYADDSAMGIHIGQFARLASKPTVETDGYLTVVPRHGWVFVLASIQSATRWRKEAISILNHALFGRMKAKIYLMNIMTSSPGPPVSSRKSRARCKRARYLG